MKVKEKKIFCYINAGHVVEGRGNSVYELCEHAGMLYIPDYRNNKVIVWDIINNIHSKNISVSMPHGCTVDTDETIYVATHKKNLIFIIGKEDCRKIENCKFNQPVSTALSKTKVYIANWDQGDSGSLLVSDKELNVVDEFAICNGKPHSVRFSDDKIYVLTRNPGVLLIYSQDGSVLVKHDFGNNFDPLSLTILNKKYIIPNYVDGKIYVLDLNFKTIVKIKAGDRYPMSTVVYRDKLFVSEEDANRIQRLDIDE
jgi:hypothetical protein